MNYYGARELADSFRTVRRNTITIANEIGEEHCGFRPAPDVRTVGQTLVHIARICELAERIHATERRTTLVGFDFAGFIGPIVADEQTPRTKAQVIELLTAGGNRYSAWLEGLSDDFLGERVTLPPGATPESKTRFEMLLGVKEHEMHHRGQLMLVERMLGLVPHLTREFQARMAAMAAAANKP